MVDKKLLDELFKLPDEEVGLWLSQQSDLLNAEWVPLMRQQAQDIGYGGDMKSALSILDRAAAVAEMRGSPLEMGLVWRGRANVYQFHSRFEESLAAMAAAIALYEKHGTPLDIAEASTIGVYVLAAMGQFDDALELAREIKPHFRAADHKVGLAFLANNVAKVHNIRRQLDEALAAYQEAEKYLIEIDAPLDQANVLHDMGLVAEQKDDFEQAAQYYWKALDIYEQHNNRIMMAKSYLNLARLFGRQDRLTEQLDYLTEARQIREALPDSIDRAYIELQEALVCRALNDPIKARDLLTSALNIFQKGNQQIDVIEVLVELGSLLAEKTNTRSMGEAFNYFEQAYNLLAELHMHPLFVGQIQLKQASLLLQLDRLIEAETTLTEAKKIFKQEGVKFWLAQTNALLADTVRQANPSQAKEQYRNVLADVGAKIPQLAAHCWYGLGQIAWQENGLSQAEFAYERALALLDSVRETLRSHKQQAGFLEDKQELVEALIRVIQKQPNSEPRLFARVEAFKARILQELLAAQPPDANTDEKLLQLLSRREQLRRRLDHHLDVLTQVDLQAGMALGQANTRAVSLNHDYEEKIVAEVRLELEAMEEAIERNRDEATDWRRGFVAEDVDVHELLDEQTIYLSYYTTADGLYALTATNDTGGIKIHALNSSLDEIKMQWRQASKYLLWSKRKGTHVQQRLARLWQVLVAPVASELQDKQRILISPHRELYQIPFAALYDNHRQQYMVERWQLQLVPNLGILSHCRNQKTGQFPPLLVGYGGKPGAPTYLPGVDVEIGQVHKLFPKATVKLQAAATKTAVWNEMANRSLVLLAGHMFYDRKRPLDSGMPLAGGEWIRASDLYHHFGYLGGATVILSGCESGQGWLSGGEVLGLTSAFLYAGAVGIIAGLWRVDDAATAQLMNVLCQELSKGVETAKALRTAQLGLLKDARFAHPYFWSPFSLTGGSRALI